MKQNLHGDPVPTVERLQHIEHVADATQRAYEKINADPELTPLGRASATSTLGKRTDADVVAWYEPIARGQAEHRAAIDPAQTAAFATESKTQDVATRIEAALVRAEIRRAAAGLTPMGIEQLYRVGDRTVRAALEEIPKVTVTSQGLPRVTSFVTDELRRAGLKRGGQGQEARLAAELENLDLVTGALRACVGVARRAAGPNPGRGGPARRCRRRRRRRRRRHVSVRRPAHPEADRRDYDPSRKREIAPRSVIVPLRRGHGVDLTLPSGRRPDGAETAG